MGTHRAAAGAGERRAEVRGGRSGGRESGIRRALWVTARPLPARAHSRATPLPALPPAAPPALNKRGAPGSPERSPVPGTDAPEAGDWPEGEAEALSSWRGGGHSRGHWREWRGPR